MSLNLALAWGYISWDVIWVRFWPDGRGVSLKRTPMLFSERSGHTKFLQLGFGWRVSILKGGG